MDYVILVGFREAAINSLKHYPYQFIFWTETPIKESYLNDFTHNIVCSFQVELNIIKQKILTITKEKSIFKIIPLKESAVLSAEVLSDELTVEKQVTKIALICHDKLHMKHAAVEKKLPITPFHLITKKTNKAHLEQTLGLPFILKQRASSGSRGLKIIHHLDQFKLNDYQDYIAEKIVHGIEYSCESFINEGRIYFENITQYLQTGKINIAPAKISKSLQQEISQLNHRVIDSFSIKNGMTHLECFVTPNEKVIFSEIAIRPPGGYIMELINLSYDFDPWQTFFDIHLLNKINVNNHAKYFSAVIIIHPGKGKVKTIKGIDNLNNTENLEHYKLKLKPGMIIEERIGLGQSYGYIFLKDKSHENLLKSIQQLSQHFIIECIRIMPPRIHTTEIRI